MQVPSVRLVLRYMFLLVCDGIACAAALYIALLLRLQGEIPIVRSEGFADAAPIFVAMTLAIMVAGGSYSRTWRYFSFVDLSSLVKLVTVSTVIAVSSLFLFDKFSWMPMSVPAIYWFVANPLFAGLRVSRRLTARRGNSRANAAAIAQRAPGVAPKRALVVGEIDWVESILEPLSRYHSHAFNPVGLLDHSGFDIRLRVHGIRVLGTIDSLQQAVERLAKNKCRPQSLIINAADPQLSGRALLALVSEANSLGLDVVKIADRRLIEFAGLDSGLQLERVNVTDLLGRPELELDETVVSNVVAGRRVMVTGAGGTIGSELVRQIARFGPAEIQLLDCGECNLYSIDVELGENFPNIERRRILCSIRQRDLVFDAFQLYRPELVFHAAALKHVPLVEENPCSGAQTNVIGTRNVADAVEKYGALAMVQVSTDKAVNPIGLMGATKRLGELYCQALDLAGAGKDAAPRFMTVRFGNVLGSSGSLIPLLQRQLNRGGPLTITHPRIERYFMTVHEAVQLILFSSSQALKDQSDRGKIFVLDMGKPVRIVDLARRMIRLSGLQPDVDVKIEFIGLRPGEKMFEELFDDSEKRLPSTTPGILRALPKAVSARVLNRGFDDIERLAKFSDSEGVRELVHNLVAYEPAKPRLPAKPTREPTKTSALAGQVGARVFSPAPAQAGSTP